MDADPDDAAGTDAETRPGTDADLTVRPAVHEDVPELESLVTEHFGEDGDYTIDVGGDAAEKVLHVAEAADGTLVGVSGLTVHGDRAALEADLYLIDTVEPVPRADRYGLLGTGYVREGHTGRGIGSRLLERMHRAGRERGVDLFLADAWFHGGPDSPERLFTDRGYEVVHRRSIADRHDGECPKCGPDCVCQAALVVRRGGG